jgi:acyl-CoA synthetase (NDP forming)
LSPFGSDCRSRLHTVLAGARIDGLVDIHNPLDLTPMTGDEAYADTVRALLEDDQFDAVVVGIVPLTAALNTLPPGAGHGEDLSRPDGIVARLASLKREAGKPWVVVVDAGAIYDPMARALAAVGIPTFRAADRALRLLNAYCAERRRGAGAS